MKYGIPAMFIKKYVVVVIVSAHYQPPKRETKKRPGSGGVKVLFIGR